MHEPHATMKCDSSSTVAQLSSLNAQGHKQPRVNKVMKGK